MEKIVKAINGGSDIVVTEEGCIRLSQLEEGIAEHDILICCPQQLADLWDALLEAATALNWID
jgi:hypothetical protein